jgi:MSHA biogenesis protein MshN
MSLINAMLQDLDRRQALGTDDAVAPVPTISTPKPRREWFWYTLAFLMAMSVAWVGWVAYQIMPRTITTKLGLHAGEQARAHPKPAAELRPVPAPAAVLAQPVAQAPVAPPPQLPPEPVRAAAFETMRLALELQKPPVAEPPQPPPQPKPRPARPPVIQAEAPLKVAPKGSVDKHDRAPAGGTAASNEFRRAMTLLNQGRVAEAQQLLAAALKADPAHANARQVYVAVLLEQGRTDHARRLLEQGLKLEPSHPEFALGLARLHTAERDYPAALQVMDRVGPAASANSNFQALRGAVLQRLGRHTEAAEAYKSALRASPQQATSWLGLAISYEALGRGAEAADLYRRALRAGPLAPDAREYAEARVLALQ